MRRERDTPGRRAGRWLAGLAFPLALGAAVVWWTAAPASPALATASLAGAGPARARLEARPTLDPALFVGKTRLAHEVARTLPDVLDQFAFFGLSLVVGHRLTLRTYPDAGTASRAFLPMAGVALVFTLVGLVVLSLPMGMRHGS
jgi:hypothetical protein